MTRKTTPRKTTPPRKTTRRPRRRARPVAAARRALPTVAPDSQASGAEGPQPETAVAPVAAGIAVSPAGDPSSETSALPADVAFASPEPGYVARVTPPEPERPVPVGRRAIFFDVENTSHSPHIERVLQHLAIDRLESRTEFVAVGNWRVIGHDIARLLAHRGAQLVHSAPAPGVRDWSDLRIAVSAGVWLAAARPGDRIEIVSDDRAFDAVGDVAATLGIEFRRLSYRALTGAPAAREPSERAPAPRGRGRGRPSGHLARVEAAPPHRAAGPRAPAERRPHAPVQAAAPATVPGPVDGHAAGEPHTAPHDEIIHVIRELIHRGHGRPVLIDALARTPGSPRLVTRLRRLKELSVSPTGMISLADGAGAAEPHVRPAPSVPGARPVDAEREEEPVAAGDQPPPAAASPEPSPPGRRRTRRGGRQHRRGPRRDTN
ncbi:MAG: hypothetical protein HYU42_04230 [Candidatus Rokubacteria bacterium]|nr:hypothetical protein [Candidatus Rokubacteria bacterium]